MTVEQRYKKVAVGGQLQEQAVSFPIWYQPQTAGKAPQVAALGFCRKLIDDWAACQGVEAAQPVLLHVFAGPSADGNSLKVVRDLQQARLPNGAPLVFQAHMISSEALVVPATLYPATPAYLTGQLRELFERTSVLPDALAGSLKKAGIVIRPKARGLIYNGRMVDLAKFLTLAEAYVEQLPASSVPVTAAPPSAPAPVAVVPPVPLPVSLPPVAEAAPPMVSAAVSPPQPVPPAAEAAPAAVPAASPPLEPIPLADLPGVADLSPVPPADVSPPAAAPAPPPPPGISSLTPDQPGLLLMLLDRSVANPYGAEPKNACTRLQRRLGDLLEKVVRFGHGTIDVGIISYGSDFSNQPEVRGSLEGALAGRPYARDTELAAGAIRVEQFEEERSDGAGGILSIPHKQPVLVEVEPAPPAPALPAFQKAGESAAAWLAEHPGDANVPLVIHLTRGQLDPGDAEQAVGHLTAAIPGAIVYHIVETEADHVSVFYPADEAGLQDPWLQTLCRLTSPLLGREALIADNPHVSEHSRGMVVNGSGDLMLEALKRAVAV